MVLVVRSNAGRSMESGIEVLLARQRQLSHSRPMSCATCATWAASVRSQATGTTWPSSCVRRNARNASSPGRCTAAICQERGSPSSALRPTNPPAPVMIRRILPLLFLRAGKAFPVKGNRAFQAIVERHLRLEIDELLEQRNIGGMPPYITRARVAMLVGNGTPEDVFKPGNQFEHADFFAGTDVDHLAARLRVRIELQRRPCGICCINVIARLLAIAKDGGNAPLKRIT